jgi:hypothetical protein
MQTTASTASRTIESTLPAKKNADKTKWKGNSAAGHASNTSAHSSKIPDFTTAQVCQSTNNVLKQLGELGDHFRSRASHAAATASETPPAATASVPPTVDASTPASNESRSKIPPPPPPKEITADGSKCNTASTAATALLATGAQDYVQERENEIQQQQQCIPDQLKHPPLSVSSSITANGQSHESIDVSRKFFFM